MSATPGQSASNRAVWAALILLFAAIVAGIAALLSYASGLSVPAAVLTGGGAFAGTALLVLAFAHYLSSDR